MDPVNPASIAVSISIGSALLAGFLSIWVAMRSTGHRDRAVSIFFGISFFLILLNGMAGGLIAVWGMAYLGLVKAALLLTAAFAVAGMGFGAVRGLRSGRAIKTQSA